MTSQDDDTTAMVARIDAYGDVELLVNGSPSRAHLPSVDEARLYVGQHAADLAAQLGREVVLDTSDPDGTWTFVYRPDGTLTETGRAQNGSAPTPAGQTPRPAAAPSAPPPELPHHSWAGPQPWAPPTPGSEHPPARAWSPQPAAAPTPLGPPAGLPTGAPPPGAPPYEPQPRRAVPTLDDLLGGRPAPVPGPAQTGWQAFVRKATFGLVKPAPGPRELQHRAAVATIQRSLPGPRTVVVVNPKGGASKTTATMLLAATFATLRGGYTLAWDNNETRGTLGWRAVPARHTNTAVDLLADLERFQQVRGARVGDLDNYVRTQGAAQFDVLASDEDPAASASIDADAFQRLHGTLSRFYRILVIDTGNNMRASNWEAAVAAADQLVIVSTIREDTAASAAWLVDGLRAKGHGDKVEHAVTILSAPASSNDAALASRLHDHFTQLTRAVVDVPHEASLVAGGPIDFGALSKQSREAWVLATAKVAEGL
jgi:MinD-like ATPase involved in chromosome partitioning or flagellar assembly